MNKLSRKDIAMLEVLAVTEESKGKLAEYIQRQGKAVKAYKAFREAVVNGVEVDKVVEAERKFKAGDKVRVLDVSYGATTSALDAGDITEVVGYKDEFEEYELLAPEERPVVVVEPEGETGLFEESALELVEEKTPNELRAEIIEKAKLFLSEEKGTVFEFIIQDKRILVLNNEEKLFAESECHPNDVFNEHIGKAIALGRALGKDVSEFESAVQPDEVVIGHVVNGDEARGAYTQEHKFTLTSKRECDAFYYAEREDDFIYNWQIGDIIDDTNAIYGLCE